MTEGATASSRTESESVKKDLLAEYQPRNKLTEKRSEEDEDYKHGDHVRHPALIHKMADIIELGPAYGENRTEPDRTGPFCFCPPLNVEPRPLNGACVAVS
ncbi:hypothetical protein D9C73_016879 [Collichthys lucidus]|uniref:Uncharacterized protein n=1 Tax=Collichthys lucidus TaxID=240159 RepID=A0A4U5V628_COLLU|nr:hypothetical protein D9C73_016879 [Collichthys lucidus]